MWNIWLEFQNIQTVLLAGIKDIPLLRKSEGDLVCVLNPEEV